MNIIRLLLVPAMLVFGVSLVKLEPDDKEQSERFEETDRDLGCDLSPEQFDAALRKVMKPKSAV